MTTKPYGDATRVPAIPDTRHAQVLDVLNAVKELMEVREGIRGDGLDKNVTLRDLLNSGLATPFDLRGLDPTGGGYPLLPTAPADPDIPPTPTNLVAVGSLRYILLTWDFARGYSRLAYFEIWRSLTDAIGDAILVGQTFAPIYADDVGPGKAYYYWVRAVSDAAKSPFNALAGTLGETAMDPAEVMKAVLKKLGYGDVDIANGVFPFTTVTALPVLPNPKYPPGVCVLLTTDGKLYRNVNNVWTAAVAASDLTGQIVESQVAAGAISTAKFAQGIEPVTIVSALPTVTGYAGTKVVFLTTDGKMYRLVGGAWTASVQAVDITGQLVSAQIADAVITTAKFAQGIEPVSVVSTLPVVAGYAGPKVVLLTTDGKLYRLVGGVWTTSLPAADITGQITGVQITDSAVTAAKIAANAITADKIAANAVTAGKIAADAVTAGTVAAGAINAREIAAGAISAEKLLVASVGSALNADPGFEDRSAWDMATIVTLTDGKVGNKAMRSTTNVPTDTYGRQFVPCDPTKVYRVRAWARRSATANGTLYIGVRCNDASGNNVPGNGTFWYAGAVNATNVVTDWTEFVGYFNGNGAGLTFNASCKTMAPIALLNYTGNSGYMEIQDLRIEEVMPGTLIQSGAVTTDKIAANAVTAAQIAAGTITAAQIAADTITAGQIAAGAISTSELAANAVSATNIAAGAVTADKIAANAITAGKIAAGTVDANALAANSVIAGKIGAGAIVAGDGVIANAAIGTAHIIDATITNAKIGALAVDDAKVANLSVAKLLAGKLGVGEYIESTNYLAGDTGFRIHGNGNSEFSNVTARGTIYATAGKLGEINIGNNNGIYSNNYTSTTGFHITPAGTATFNEITIRGTVLAVNGTLGNLEILGHLRSGQSTYDTGTGWWFGYVAAVPKFSIGTGPTGPAMLWDGSNLIIRGATFDAFTATSSKVAVPTRANTTLRVSMGTATISVTGGKLPISYQWALLGDPLVSPDNRTASTTLTNANDPTVTVMATASNDTNVTAVVMCVAVDANGRSVSQTQGLVTQFGTPV